MKNLPLFLAGFACISGIVSCSKNNTLSPNHISANGLQQVKVTAPLARKPIVPAVTAYWLPYAGADDQMPLKRIPTVVDVLTLFAGGLHPATTEEEVIDTRLMVSGPRTDWDKIMDSVQIMRKKGRKVTLSLFMNDWTNVAADFKYDDFAAAVRKKVIDDWKLDGIDLDIEGNPVNANTYKAVKSLAKYFGPLSGTSNIMSAVVYDDNGFTVLKNTKGSYDYVATMDYWNVGGGEDQDTYSAIVSAGVPVSGVLFGISTEEDKRSYTNVENVKKVLSWKPAEGKKGGVMVFDIGGDFTQGFPIMKTIAGKNKKLQFSF